MSRVQMKKNKRHLFSYPRQLLSTQMLRFGNKNIHFIFASGSSWIALLSGGTKNSTKEIHIATYKHNKNDDTLKNVRNFNWLCALLNKFYH